MHHCVKLAVRLFFYPLAKSANLIFALFVLMFGECTELWKMFGMCERGIVFIQFKVRKTNKSGRSAMDKKRRKVLCAESLSHEMK